MSQTHESTNGISDLSSRIAKCSEELKALSAAAKQDQNAQKQLLGVFRQVTGMLEPPPESVFKFIMAGTVTGVLRSAVKLGIIDTINAHDKPQSAASLGKAAGIDPNMTGMMLIVCFSGPGSSAFLKLADWLSEYGSKDPDSVSIGPWQYANNTDLSFFDWLHKHPADHKIFDDFMADFICQSVRDADLTTYQGQRANRKEWFETFPVQSILFDGASSSPSSPLLIDIGGGIGEELGVFAKQYPSASGCLILQDLPETIANAKSTLSSAITPMAYDFFTPQPVMGARAYYFRFVFHDWSDKKCVEILKNTAKGMERGYSKLLIHEWVLPDVGAPLQGSLMDLNMMCIPGGMERTESQWRKNLDEAGLRIEKIWVDTPDAESLIEAVLA
ncbi:MAG: hypothetical protein Q9220_002270 [cf. Caloplaca sp. 1 TL-2023]